MVLDGKPLLRNVEYPLSFESEIKFTEPDVKIYKLKVSDVKDGRQADRTSTKGHKKLRKENER